MSIIGGISGYYQVHQEWKLQDSSESSPDEKLGIFFEVRTEPSFFIAVKMMFTWILIFTNLVPISLMVSLELVKFF